MIGLYAPIVIGFMVFKQLQAVFTVSFVFLAMNLEDNCILSVVWM